VGRLAKSWDQAVAALLGRRALRTKLIQEHRQHTARTEYGGYARALARRVDDYLLRAKDPPGERRRPSPTDRSAFEEVLSEAVDRRTLEESELNAQGEDFRGRYTPFEFLDPSRSQATGRPETEQLALLPDDLVDRVSEFALTRSLTRLLESGPFCDGRLHRGEGTDSALRDRRRLTNVVADWLDSSAPVFDSGGYNTSWSARYVFAGDKKLIEEALAPTADGEPRPPSRAPTPTVFKLQRTDKAFVFDAAEVDLNQEIANTEEAARERSDD